MMNVEEFMNKDLDVQKIVVESLAAEKAEQDEKISELSLRNEHLITQISVLKGELAQKDDQIAQLKQQLADMGDVLARNSEGEASNKIALIDRNPDIADKFPGETRDHVLDVLTAARDEAEQAGRLRRAQLLESVLLVNEKTGNVAKFRTEVEKIFTENANIVNGTVIAELKRRGIAHKHGEEYLLPSEILDRNY